MKPEKEPAKKQPAETEREIRNEMSDRSLDEISAELEDRKNELLLEFKKLVDQKIATIDFEKDNNGEVESVTITRVVNGETLFHANNKSWTGREDIKRVLGLMNSGKPD